VGSFSRFVIFVATDRSFAPTHAESNAYFADGIKDEILARLSKIAALLD
jgi:TolB-like protein